MSRVLVALSVLVVGSFCCPAASPAADLHHGSAAIDAPPAPGVPAAVQVGDEAVPVVTGALPTGRWAWPLTPRPTVLAGFRPPPQPWLPGHRGVDLAASAGAPVLAPADGVIAFAGVAAGRPVLSIVHPGGLRTTYEPVIATLAVGASVRRGQIVGTVAPGAAPAAHSCPAGCLHWGAKRGTDYVDPLRLIRGGPPVLLPLR